MIIYGWGHFNRRDHSLVRGRCRVCGHTGYLASYTSTKFFTLYFIPVIPLGSEKILEECPACKRALTLSLRKWRKLRRTELPAAVAAYETKPADPEAARGVVNTCVGLQDRAALLRAGPTIRSAFARDGAMLGHLAGAYSYLTLDKEADATYLEAVALAPEADVAAEANAHLELERQTRPKPPNRLLQSLPVLIVPAILAFVALSMLQDALSSEVRRGYVVNGLGRPYTIEVNGELMTLRPHVAEPVECLRFGANVIAPASGASYPPARTVTIDVSWLDRLFSQPAVVVNPDLAAVMVWERTAYTSSSGAVAGDHQVRVRTGEAVHVYEEVDYLFTDFPRSITMSGSGVRHRTRVSDAGGLEIRALFNILGSYGSPSVTSAFLRARLAGGDETHLIHIAARLLPREEFLALAGERLALRPVLVEWHRAYQTLLDGAPGAPDLEAHYRGLVEKEPGDSSLVYLLGRATDDPAASLATLERAAAMQPPSAYAANAAAFHHVCEGNFAEAARWNALALRIEPASESFKALRQSILCGMRDHLTADKEAGDPLAARELNLNAFASHLYRLAKLGRQAQLEPEILRFLRVSREAGWSDEGTTRAYLETFAAIGAGDRAAFERAAARIEGPVYALQRALVAGNLDRALQAAADYGRPLAATDSLVLYTLLARAGRTDAAAARLELAISTLKSASGPEQEWARWLAGTEPPPVERALHVCPNTDDQPVFLTALAQRFPAQADELLAWAEKIRWLDTYATLALAPRPAP